MIVRIRNTFFTGIAVIFPIAVTFLLIKFLMGEINRWILNPFTKFLTPYVASPYTIYASKVVVFLLVFCGICVIGWAANVIVIRKFFGMWENLFLKVPMVGKVYNAVKQISTAFFGQGKTIFKKVVLIEYPRKGVYSLGFVTGEGKGEVRSATHIDVVNVFVPTTPNPTSGIFLLVPKNDITFLKMTVEEGMKMVISGGAVVPPFHEVG